MDFEKQKPTTEAYREGWERVWGSVRLARNVEEASRQLTEKWVRDFNAALEYEHKTGDTSAVAAFVIGRR